MKYGMRYVALRLCALNDFFSVLRFALLDRDLDVSD